MIELSDMSGAGIQSGQGKSELSASQRLLGILFYLNQETSKKELGRMFGISPGELQADIDELVMGNHERGIVVIQSESHVSLGTHKDLSTMIGHMEETESMQPLSKAALETLAIVAYKAPVTRMEVDAIRGVNSLYSLRNLLVRGLVSRTNKDGAVTYELTVDTYRLLGISGASELPDKAEIDQKIDQILSVGVEVKSKSNAGMANNDENENNPKVNEL